MRQRQPAFIMLTEPMVSVLSDKGIDKVPDKFWNYDREVKEWVRSG